MLEGCLVVRPCFLDVFSAIYSLCWSIWVFGSATEPHPRFLVSVFSCPAFLVGGVSSRGLVIVTRVLQLV